MTADESGRSYLIEEPPILVYPTLAMAIGINAAVILQQLHFLLGAARNLKHRYNFVDGRWWIYNSYTEWQVEQFPWLSESTIKSVFIFLERAGIVLVKQSVKNRADRRKWYSIDYKRWAECQQTMRQNLSDGTWDKICLMVRQNLSDHITENYTESLDSSFALAQDIDEVPNHDTGLLSKKTSNQPDSLARVNDNKNGAAPTADKPPRRPAKNKPLIDAVAQHIEKIDPKQAGRQTGYLAAAIAAYWRKLWAVDAITAEQYVMIAETVEPFIIAFNKTNSWAGALTIPAQLESTYARLWPRVQAQDKQQHDPDCAKCHGDGWEEYDENGYRYVRRCNCTAPIQTGVKTQ